VAQLTDLAATNNYDLKGRQRRSGCGEEKHRALRALSRIAPAVAAAAIAVDVELVIDLATPGRVKTLPVASGTYLVIGRNRFTVANRGRSRIDRALRAAHRRRPLTPVRLAP
jgi:hypothetical protein